MEKKYYELLQDVRKNPNIFLGKPSIWRFCFFHIGYVVYNRCISDDCNDQFFSDFQHYIQDKYKINLAVKAESIIGFYCGDDEAGFYKYFELIDEFLEEQNSCKLIRPVILAAKDNHKKEITNESLINLLLEIYKRPILYIGKISIERLYYFIQGCLVCSSNEQSLKEVLSNDDFQKFLQLKYNITTTKNWEEIISFFSADEKEALDNFFLLITESLNLRGIPFELPERSPVYRP